MAAKIRIFLVLFGGMLIFATDVTWTKFGLKDLRHLTEKIEKLDHSKSRVDNELRFAILGPANIRHQLKEVYLVSVREHNKQVALEALETLYSVQNV